LVHTTDRGAPLTGSILQEGVLVLRKNLMIIYIYIYFTVIGLIPGGSRTLHIYTQNTESGTYITTKKLNIYNNKKIN
jgi:hypothetical protein